MVSKRKLIVVDLEVEEALKKRMRGFESRNSVLRRLLKLPPIKEHRGRPKKKI